MIGAAGPRGPGRSGRLAAALMLMVSLPIAGPLVPPAAGAPAPAPIVAPAGPVAAAAPGSGRILFAGTDHRALDRVAADATTTPLFGPGPAHFDEQPAASGDRIVFTSLRESATPQVYLRDADGTIHRLTTGLDAAHPRLTPDGASVVFDAPVPGGDAERDLWIVGTDGTGLRRLTDTPGDEVSPTVSADGASVAYATGTASGSQIYEQPLAGGPVTRLTGDTGGAAIAPIWNPVDDTDHRNLLAYTFAGDNGTDQLRLIDCTCGGTGQPLLSGAAADWSTRSAAWLPDGAGFVFVSPDQPAGTTDPTAFDKVYRSELGSTADPQAVLCVDRGLDSPTWVGTAAGGQVVVEDTSATALHAVTLQDVNPDGSDPRDLGVSILNEDPAADTNTDPAIDPLFNPAPGYDPWVERQNYTPDGRQIVVTRFEDSAAGRIERIWLAADDGTDAHPMPLDGREPTTWDTDPIISPNGRLIAFTRTTPGGVGTASGPARVVIADVATGAIVGTIEPPVGEASTGDAQPAWSPDGTTLAFTRNEVINGGGGNKHIWLVPLDDLTQQRDLSATVCPGACTVIDDSPAFAPDGSTIAFNRKDGAGAVDERDGILDAATTGGDCRVLLPAGLTGDPDACRQQLPDTSDTGPFQPRDVAWTANGAQLILSARRALPPNSPEELAIYDLAGGTLTPLDAGLPGRQKEPSIQQTVDLAVSAPPTVGTVRIGDSTAVTVTVTNHGPAPSPDTTLTVAPPSGVRLTGLTTTTGECPPGEVQCALGLLAPGATVQVTATLVGVTAGEQPVGWSVAGASLDANPTDDAATTIIPVAVAPPTQPPPTQPPPPAAPGLSITAQPHPGFVGGRVVVTYTVRNAGRTTATGLRLTLGLPASVRTRPLPAGCTATACGLPDLASGASVVTRVVLAPTAPITTTITGRLTTTGTDDNLGNNVARAPLRILRPRIIAVPKVGRPGFVTLVRGVDFPPGVPVRLTWKPGITAAAAPSIPGRDLRFTGQLLILAKDQTGPRTIFASGPGFSRVHTSFLVVNGTIAPPDQVERR